MSGLPKGGITGGGFPGTGPQFISLLWYKSKTFDTIL